MKEELTDQGLHDMHKVIYLAKEYPSKTIGELAEMFEIAIIDFNAAFWYAQDKGYIRVEEDENKKEFEKKFSVIKTPEKFVFGPTVEHLLKTIPYILTKLAEKESDLVEFTLSQWSAGYSTQDQFVALKKLMDKKVIATYDLTDVDTDKEGKETKNVYTFYTLAENSEQLWGRKQFKDPKKLK